MTENAPYKVFWLSQATTTLEDFGLRAPSDDVRRALADAIQILDEKLRSRPLELGEPYRTRFPVEERQAIQDFLAIDYTVDQARGLVAVRACVALSGHGL